MASPLPSVLLALSGLTLTSTAHGADFQHALIIVLDDVGVDKVGAYAGDVENEETYRPVTPTMDLLANAGVRFTAAWGAPVCSPSRAMLLTGEYGYRTGVGGVIAEGNPLRLHASPPGLAQVAAESGLRAGMFGKWHLGELSRSPDAPTTVPLRFKELAVQLGFFEFAGNTDGEVPSYTRWLRTRSAPLNPEGERPRYETSAALVESSVTAQTLSDALAFMEAQAAGGHRNLTVVALHLAHATRDEGGPWGWEGAAGECDLPAGTEIARFQQAVQCADDALLTLLLGTPALEDSLVVLLSDNGTEKTVAEGSFLDRRGKGSAYENGVRVPFILADGAAVKAALEGGTVPGGDYVLPPGTVSDAPASVVDVFATVVDLLDLSPHSCTPGLDCGRDSLSMRDVLTGGDALRTETWTENFGTSAGLSHGKGALRQGTMKLVSYGSEGGCRSHEMYDLASDRFEQVDLFDDPAWAVEQASLLARLEEHRALMHYAWLPALACD